MNRTALTRWWQGLALRERALVGAGVLVVALVAVYVLLWEPPVAGIRKLESDLPRLRSQDASLQAMADEAAHLRIAAGHAQPIAPADRVAATRRSLERAGLTSAGAESADAATGPTATPVRTLSVGGTVTTLATSTTTRTSPPDVRAEGERVRVRFDDIDYGVWVAWLANAETTLSARAAHVAVVTTAPKSPVGHVRADVLLDWTPAGAPRS